MLYGGLKMKFMLVTLNSKYIHSSLALRCLYTSVKDDFDVTLGEYTINDNMHHILSNIYRKKCDVVAFSCYIWNFKQTLEICENLKQANPDIKIILGGPEVSYSSRSIMQKYPFVDFIISGEGEITIRQLFDAIDKNGSYIINGLTWRNDNKVTVNAPREPVLDFDSLPFVYNSDSILQLENKIIYYESSRGCPFSCSYCLSGENSKVRFLSVERVKKDIDFFVNHNVPLVKFVDRTFNANKTRAYQIFEYIIDNPGNTKFHMELAGDLLDDKTINLLANAPKDIMQFEIGVQTTNRRTMEAINRKINQDKLFDNIKKLIKNGNIHIHLDLIAGLALENLESFKKSFNDVMLLQPDVLQIGFLKLLDGSKVRGQIEKYGYRFCQNPPYEVISNDFISYDEILFLHDFEDVFEKYYNSGCFNKTMHRLFEIYNNYFDVFADIVGFFQNNRLYDVSLSKQKLYDVLYDFSKEKNINISEYLKFDYIKNIKSHTVPHWCATEFDLSFENRCHEILQNEEFKKQKLPNYYDVPAKKVMKTVHFERFSDKIILFDYNTDTQIDVTSFFE